MVDEDNYCIDVLTQISAIQSALKSVSLGLMEEHLGHCVKHAVEHAHDTGDTSDMDAKTKKQKVEALQAQIQMVQAQISAIQRQNQQAQIEKQKQAELAKAQKAAETQAKQNNSATPGRQRTPGLGDNVDTFA